MRFNVYGVGLAMGFATQVLCQEEEYHHIIIPRTRDDICQPSRTGMKEYNGFRIQHQIIGRWPNIRHTRISECHHNEVQGWDAYHPSSQHEDLQWGKKFCQQGLDGESLCFIMARTKKMARRNTSLFVHGAYVGGLFQCPGRLQDDEFECTNENSLPIYALYADDPVFSFSEYPDVRHLVVRVPMIASHDESNVLAPDIIQYVRDPFWYKYIDIHEEYNYSVDERKRLYRAYDDMYTRLAAHAHVPFRLRYPTLASNAIDVGDGTPRRPVYKLPIRRLFEPHLWQTYDIHPAPFRDAGAKPIEEGEEGGLHKREFTNEKFKFPELDSDTLATIMSRANPAKWRKMKEEIHELFENVVSEVQEFKHLPPHENITQYLMNRWG